VFSPCLAAGGSTPSHRSGRKETPLLASLVRSAALASSLRRRTRSASEPCFSPVASMARPHVASRERPAADSREAKSARNDRGAKWILSPQLSAATTEKNSFRKRDFRAREFEFAHALA
jgi:hypothetical protein